MRALLGAVLALALTASAGLAREIDYTKLDAVGFAATAQRLKIAPVSAAVPLARPLAVTVAAAADHETLALGIYCAAFDIANPVSRLMAMLAAEAASPAQAAQGEGAPLRLTVTTARSWRRCVEVGELNVRCITRVTLAGEVAAGEAAARPVTVSVERDASIGPFCEAMAQGVGVVTREAAQQLLAAATAG